MTLTYDEIKQPMTRDEVITTALAILSAAGIPTTSWGPTDEPYATVAADAEVLVDLSKKIAGLAKMGVTDDAEEDVLKVHAKDVFDVDKLLAVPAQGTVRATETAGTPHTWAAGDLTFCDKNDDSVTYRNIGSVTLGALGTLTFQLMADATGSRANIQATDLIPITTVPGVTFAAEGAGTTWIAVAGTDDESDPALRLRCKSKWSTLTTTGPAAAYTKWALDSSASINRVFVQEDPTAVYPDPAVTLVVAGPTGAVGGAVITVLTAYVEAKRPLGVLVAYGSASNITFNLTGEVRVKAGQQTTATASIHALLDAWFSGSAITVNGESVPGLQIADRVRISQLIEIVMSVPGVLSFTPRKADNVTVYVPETDDLVLLGNEVAVLVRGLTYTPVT